MNNSFKQRLIAVLASAALAATFIASGFAICAGIPATTELLAGRTCNAALSPFDEEQLVKAALATRAYTVEDNDRSAVMSTIALINAEAGTPYANATPAELSGAPGAYTLTADALDHLDDVFGVVNRVMPALLGFAALAAFLLMASVRMYSTRLAGRELIFAGAVPLAVFAVLAAWVIVDFNGFFAAFHSLFFAAGTWTFPADSLLICMYPQAFWMGMGLIWLVTTCLFSILSVVFGYVLSKKRVSDDS